MDDRDPRGTRPGAEPAGLAPVRAFFLLGTLLTAIAAGFFATRDPAPSAPSASPPRSPDYALTDAEAIAEFERLKGMLIAAYKRRDITLIDEFVAPDAAPGIRRIDDEIRTLVSDGVLYRTRETRESLDVTRNDPDEIELREVVIKTPRFVLERSGRNLATTRRPERQSIVWVLRLYRDEWRIYSSTIVSAEPAGEERR